MHSLEIATILKAKVGTMYFPSRCEKYSLVEVLVIDMRLKAVETIRLWPAKKHSMELAHSINYVHMYVCMAFVDIDGLTIWTFKKISWPFLGNRKKCICGLAK
jgi:hypothetical protein